MIRTQSLGLKRYVLTCGTSAVHVWWSAKHGGWCVRPQGEAGLPKPDVEVCDNLRDAKAYAHDWLAEYA